MSHLYPTLQQALTSWENFLSPPPLFLSLIPTSPTVFLQLRYSGLWIVPVTPRMSPSWASLCPDTFAWQVCDRLWLTFMRNEFSDTCAINSSAFCVLSALHCTQQPSSFPHVSQLWVRGWGKLRLGYLPYPLYRGAHHSSDRDNARMVNVKKIDTTRCWWGWRKAFTLMDHEKQELIGCICSTWQCFKNTCSSAQQFYF